MVKEGAIGKVKEVHCWSSATFAQAPRPDGEETIPEGLSWDLWLGGAPSRPYQSKIYHPFNWRGWQDFGGGAIADFACHIMDTPFKALDLAAPLSVRCTGAEDAWLKDQKRRSESWPQWETFEYSFAGTPFTTGPTLPLFWYDGGRKPSPSQIPGMEGREVPGNGAAIVGEEATLLIVHFGSRPQLLRPGKPPELRRKMEPGSPQEHYTSFVLACLGEGKTTSHFDYAVPLTTAALLGTIAVRFPDKTLTWDETNGTLAGDPDAAKLVSQAYRDGWSLEKI
jgi:predicted dehydrogenase